MAGKFKFQDFLTPQERKALNVLREKLGGKTIYIPYPDEDHYHEFLQKRNQKIRRMYRLYKKLGLSNSVIYAEISIRLSCAKHLSMNRIRAIIRGYKEYKGRERGSKIEEDGCREFRFPVPVYTSSKKNCS